MINEPCGWRSEISLPDVEQCYIQHHADVARFGQVVHVQSLPSGPSNLDQLNSCRRIKVNPEEVIYKLNPVYDFAVAEKGAALRVRNSP